MRVCIIVMLSCIVMFSDQMIADFQEFSVCDEDGVQKLPDIDGNFVVWQHGTLNEDVGYKDLTGVYGSGRLLISGDQETPVVNNGIVYWYDKTGSDRDIAGYDLINGTTVFLPVDDGVNQRYPKVSDTYLICDQYNSGSYNGAYMDTGQYRIISPAALQQSDWTIDGSRVVWRQEVESVQQIYFKDLDRADPSVRIFPISDNQWRPDISGDLIVWEQTDESGNRSLMLYDLSQSSIVWNHPVFVQADPAICDGIIVWNDSQDGRPDRDIFGYDYHLGTCFDIATGSADDILPAISGRTVVWQRNDNDIFGAEISELTSLTLISPNGGHMYLAESEIDIHWQSQGDSVEQIRIDYSVNDGQSWEVIEPNVPDTGAYLWTPIADVDSQLCCIRVSVFNDTAVYDISDEAFTIYQCSEHLSADLTGDCFVGIDDFSEMAAQWLGCGNPYDVNCFGGAGQ